MMRGRETFLKNPHKGDKRFSLPRAPPFPRLSTGGEAARSRSLPFGNETGKEGNAVLQGRVPSFSQYVLRLSEIAHPEERAFGMVQIIGEHFAGHGDGGQFLTDEADLAAERKGHLPALHDKPRPLIGLAYEQQFAGDVAGGQRINKLLVGRLAIGGTPCRRSRIRGRAAIRCGR